MPSSLGCRSVLLASVAGVCCAGVAATSDAQLRHGTAEDIGNGVTANEADGVLLRAHVTLAQMSLDTGLALVNGNDCWGYESGSGRSYALMGTDKAMVVYEVTDPFEPQYVAHIPHTLPGGTLWSDIKTYQQYAYVVTDGSLHSKGIQAIDLSGIDAGIVTLVNEVQPSGMQDVHNLAINEQSGLLYTCLADQVSTGLVVFDIGANPTNPPVLGSYDIPGIHDAQVVTMSSGPWAGREIAFCFAEGLGIDIVDMTDPAVPVQLSRTTYTNLLYSHQGWFDEANNLLYMNDELDELSFGIPTATRIFDVSDLTNPFLVGSATNGRRTIDHNLYIKGSTLYEANYVSGVHIYDLSVDPTNPTPTGFFDTTFEQERATFDGAWNVYPFFSSDFILVSDLSAGLFVLDAAPAASGGMPMEFSFPNGLPTVLRPVGATVSVRIQGRNGNTIDPTSGVLHVVVGGIETSLPLVHVGGDLFEAQFPSLDCGQVIYWIGATASNGLHVNSPMHAPVEGFTATVFSTFSTFERRLFESGESGVGWSIGLPSDTATTGIWERAEPVPSGAQPGSDALDDGAMCFVTGNALSAWLPSGTNDIDGGMTTLTTPLFDASGGDAYVSCQLWYVNQFNGNTNVDDVLAILISDDGGSTWLPFQTVNANTVGWERMIWRINDVITPTTTMSLRFIASDTGGGSLVECALDELAVYVVDGGLGAGDLNGDGTTDGIDLLMLLGNWGSPGPSDLNGNGTTDGVDLLVLLGNWGINCGGTI